ncbi:MAG: ribosomal protein L7/L12 [Oscillospiraceae bacterium]|nr:ribosomal protein L7/L12 [Oscillospiraceae bacterium]
MGYVFCPACGTQQSDSNSFCTSCGKALSAAAEAASSGYTSCGSESGKYDVILQSCGDRVATAAEIIRDICGYTLAEAQEIVNKAPTLLARDLTLEQARAICLSLSNNGMSSSARDAQGVSTEYSASTSESADMGTTLLGAGVTLAAVLATISAANRIKRPAAPPPRPYEAAPPRRERPRRNMAARAVRPTAKRTPSGGAGHRGGQSRGPTGGQGRGR